MAENRHIFNNLAQVEKIKPKIDNPIIVEDVAYNFSDLIENEWISHFPQYSHRMRSTFVKGAGIVDEHLANINQCLIQLEDELYRVYDKLSDDKKAEVTGFIQARQNEVNEFIQARKDEVASFISDRKTEVTDFIKDRKNEVSTFISDKQNLVDEFVQKRKDEVVDFIKSKTNEVSKYISQKEEQITKFIKDKDSEIKKRTDTLDSYTKDLEGKIDQFNHVIQGGEATEDKLGLIRLSTISEQVQVATVENLKQALITPNFKDTTPVKWSVNLTVQYGSKEKKIVVDNLNKTKLDYVFNSSDYSEFANCHKQTETITRADEEVKNVDKVIYLKLKQVTVRWHITSEDGKIDKTIEEVVPTQNNSFIYQFDPSKYSELAKYEIIESIAKGKVEISDENETIYINLKLQLKQEHPRPEPPHPEPTPAPPVPEPEPGNPSGGGMSSTDKVITQKDVTNSFFNTKEEIEAELKTLKEKGVSTKKLKVNDKVYTMGLVKEFKIYLTEKAETCKRITFYNGHSEETLLRAAKEYEDSLAKKIMMWQNGTVDFVDEKYKFVLNDEYSKKNIKDFLQEFYDFIYKFYTPILGDEIIKPNNEELKTLMEEYLYKFSTGAYEEKGDIFLLYPIMEEGE